MKKILATPKAKKYAYENHLSMDDIKGSGEYGSIRYGDLKNAHAGKKITSVAQKMADYYKINVNEIKTGNKSIGKDDVLKYVNFAEIKPLSQKRRALANNIQQSLNNSAQYTLFSELDTTVIMNYFAGKKAEILDKTSKKLTFTDILVFVAAKALMNCKKLNSSLIGDKMYLYNYVNISIAVANDDGLVAPVIKGANLMRLEQILDTREDIVRRSKERRLTPDDMAGGTFTISNLGNSFVTYFTPIINYPQSAILGVGKTEKKPKVIQDSIVVRDVTYFSLTMDHLILDGKDGDHFFAELNEILQHPHHYIV